jgi:hypothetical protein
MGITPSQQLYDHVRLLANQAAASADAAAASADEAANSATQGNGIAIAIGNGTAPDAGVLTGAETIPMSRSAGVLQKTLSAIAQWILALVCPSVANFASLPATPTGFYLVLADETKGGGSIIYFFTTSHRYWIAMVQDA